ncbi:cytochrome P450 [Lindgomyces ingoldianus]|uniref:Cytochrome P450 n=1 Tax=Lindgomyces ingoldianus TaxID=673940 RepID=A0ACB6QZV9_9PLEO|nr:cytochrome P450 [Lindgomyces ingoldianus]KAF2472380.1 cytochrome P450 [Lindgomyces ingoldianus]
MTSTSFFIATLLLALGVLVLGKLWNNYQWSRKYKLPPGPKGVPYFGNMFQMPPFHQGPWAKEMAEKYGEMFTIKVADNTWVFLNSSRTVNALLEKRSAIYSSRPRFPYTSTLMSGGCRMVVQPYGPQWRSIRKIMHSILNIKNAATFAPFQDLESRHLVWDYLCKPEEWFRANQRFANSVIMSVVFAKRAESSDENIEKLFDTSREFIAALQPGANLVDTFYILDRLPKPLQWWRVRGNRAFQKVLKVYTTEVNDLKRRMTENKCPPCFATHFLSAPETAKLGETQTLFALGSLMEAGSDTSRMTLSQIIAAAAKDPRWVKKAQDELDAICGYAVRLPDFSDRHDLPYMSAVTKEGFRWRPFAEIGVPHMLIKDDEFEGYRFPKDTVFTWNSWAIALDEREHKDALRFWPERWLDPEIEGFGRRVCTGYHVGDTNVWIAAARLLYCFNFAENPEHKIDTMNLNVGEHRFAPFEVNITVRSERHKELIERIGKPAVGVKY